MKTIKGTNGDDLGGIFGSAADELIYGLDGNDNLDGGGGNDTLYGGNGADGLVGSFGTDVLYGGAGNDVLYADGNDTSWGGAGNDDLSGGAVLNGGDGADRFFVGGPNAVPGLLLGGGGRDTYFIAAPSHGAGSSVPVIRDFTTGAGGDLLNLDDLLLSSSYIGGNPFTLGYLSLVQSGANTGVYWNHDGPGGDAARLMVTLQGVTAAQITAANIVGGIPPGGGEAQGSALTGTSGADTLVGGFFDDELAGLGGADQLEGKIGDDSVAGGNGNDNLIGGYGNDTLSGGDGDDDFFTLSHIFIDGRVAHGDDRLLGGAGNDQFADALGHNTLLGGDGADVFHTTATSSAAGSSIAAGGPGRDTYVMELPQWTAGSIETDYLVTDFAGGAGGDLLDVGQLLVASALDNYYHGGNPFSSGQGFFRLVQAGGDTLLQWDRDGAAGSAYDWATQLTLTGVLPGEIGVANFADGIRPNGTSSRTGRTITGTSGGDTLTGGFDNDRIYGYASHAGSGFAGNYDFLNGGFGNDWIDGGSDEDFLSGGFGDDTLIGGDGNDDFLANDQFGDGSHSFGNDRLFGGTGDDYFEDSAGINVMDGGGGNDRFLVASIGGPGNRSTVTGASGRDTYELSSGQSSTGADYRVTDFDVGRGGDLLDVDGLLRFGGTNGGYTGGDPFAQGFLRFLQSGANTLLQWDVDGAAGSSNGWKTMLTLLSVSASSITPENFTSRLVVGTAGDDSLQGGLGNDTLQGLAGSDTLDGSLGRDILQGGTGGDTYFVDRAGDVVREAADDPGALVLHGSGEALAASSRADLVIAAVNYSLARVAFVENLTLSGAAARATGNALANRITGNEGGDTLAGGGGNDTLDGGGGADRLLGGGGNDTLVWGSGDRLDGGDGADTLKVKSGNLDLAGLPNDRILGVETIDLANSSDNTLTLTARDVLALNGADRLTVLGDRGDVIEAAGFNRIADSGGFHRYKNGVALLLVDADISVN